MKQAEEELIHEDFFDSKQELVIVNKAYTKIAIVLVLKICETILKVTFGTVLLMQVTVNYGNENYEKVCIIRKRQS